MRRTLLPLLAVPLAVILLVVAVLGGGGVCDTDGDGGSLSADATSEIPPDIARIYLAMADRWNIDVAFLASIGAQETDHGRHPATNQVNSSGCVGVMQLGTGGACGDFWGTYKCDGNGDGRMDVLNAWDNICGSARGLREGKGAPPTGGSEAAYYQAACGYYGACADYAPTVMARAKRYGFVGGRATSVDTFGENVAAGDAPARTLLNLGDSLAVGVERPLGAALRGWTVETDASTGRSTRAGVDALEQRDEDLPSVIVVSLGTNDSPRSPDAFREQVDRLMQMAGSERCVLWAAITRPAVGGASYDRLNEVLTDASEAHPNLHVVDPPTTQLVADGVHLTPGGYEDRADYIAQAADSCLGAISTAGCQASTPIAGDGEIVVDPGANRPGAELRPELVGFLRRMADLLPRPPIVTTGTNHSRYTLSGNVSDHWDGYAADLGSVRNGFPASGGGYGDKIAEAAFLAAGEPPAAARAKALAGGLYTITRAGLRIQIIWKTYDGGNHYHHVHVGVHPTAAGTV